MQNFYNLALFSRFELANAVIGFDNGRRFDEYGFSGGRFVVHDTFDFTLERRVHRNDKAAVTHGRADVPLDVTFVLRFVYDVPKSV